MKKIGIAGFGFIGSYLFEKLKDNKEIEVVAVWEPFSEKTTSLDQNLICKDLDDLGSKPLDLVVEAAHADVVKDLWPRITSGADFMMSSMTSLSDPEFRAKIERESIENGQKIFLPHAAILGLDGLRDGRSLLDSVSVTTKKHPKNLGIMDREITEKEVVFKGATVDACKAFPRNVNVHAAIALAGLGFEATQSIVIADPETDKMQHTIEINGNGLKWNLEIESFSAGTVTGSYTPESLHQSVLNILARNSGFCTI